MPIEELPGAEGEKYARLRDKTGQRFCVACKDPECLDQQANTWQG